jgi:hypothetical protein
MKIKCIAYWTEPVARVETATVTETIMPTERVVAWIDGELKHHIETIPTDEQIEVCFVGVRVEMTGLYSWNATSFEEQR